MTHKETALQYVQCFAGRDIDGLGSLLAEGLRFTGPDLRVDSRAAYLDALRHDPPDRCDAAILSVTGEGDEVVVFYELLKPGGKLTVAQWFGFGAKGIHETRLVF